MRYTFNICLFLICCMTAFGQVKVSPQEQQRVLQQFNASSSSLVSMQCDFVQKKEDEVIKK